MDLSLEGRLKKFTEIYMNDLGDKTSPKLDSIGEAFLRQIVHTAGYVQLAGTEDIYVRTRPDKSIDVFVQHDLITPSPGFSYLRLRNVFSAGFTPPERWSYNQDDFTRFIKQYKDRMKPRTDKWSKAINGTAYGALAGLVLDIPLVLNRPEIAYSIALFLGSTIIGGFVGYMKGVIDYNREEARAQEFLKEYKNKIIVGKQAILMALTPETPR